MNHMPPIRIKTPEEARKLAAQREAREAQDCESDRRLGLGVALPEEMRRVARKASELVHWEHDSDTGLWLVQTAGEMVIGFHNQRHASINLGGTTK